MARFLLLLVGVLIAGALAGSEFLPEDNPIRQVVDGLHELESSVVEIVGNSRRALSFARFAHRFIISSFLSYVSFLSRLALISYLFILPKGTGRGTMMQRR